MTLITFIHEVRKYKSAEETDKIVHKLNKCMDIVDLNRLSQKEIANIVHMKYSTLDFSNKNYETLKIKELRLKLYNEMLHVVVDDIHYEIIAVDLHKELMLLRNDKYYIAKFCSKYTLFDIFYKHKGTPDITNFINYTTTL